MALKEKKHIKEKYSDEFLQNIKLRDFQGQLNDEQIEIAKSQGLLRWDLWRKASKLTKLTFEQHNKGLRLAPVFDGFGNLDSSRYTKKTRFLIKNYYDLKPQYTR